MRSKEPKVRAESDYYLYTPSATACRLYLYPICLGQFFYEAGYAISRSHYDSFLLMYVAKGCCHLQFENQSVTALKDQVILLDCYSPHEYGFPQDSEIYWIHFDGPLAREYYNTITEDRGYAFSVKNLYPVTHNMEKLLELFRTSSPIRESSVSLRISQILNELLASQAETGSSQSRSQVVENSLAYINEHFSEPLSLEEVARNANLSPYYFTRVFTRETGMTPHQYLIAARLNSAKYLLRTNGMSIKEIAFSSGFNSESSFCSTFKKWEKVTPSEYRTRFPVNYS